mmetsp:Transcript_45414/g.52254  ORF Transcript_45414/g.52254 Transcript_45414/m.52254 type:complete len:436 (-) Transcript_45414:193-1500(-)
MIQQIFVTKQPIFEKATDGGMKTLRYLIGNGLPLSNGECWKKSRRMANKAFTNENMIKMVSTMESKIKNYISRVLVERKASNSVSPTRRRLDLDFIQITLNVIGSCAFGNNFEGEKGSEGTSAAKLPGLVSDMLEILMAHPRFAIFPGLLSNAIGGVAKTLHDSRQQVRNFGHTVLSERIARIKKDRSVLTREVDLLNLLIKASLDTEAEAEDQEKQLDELLTDDQLLDECLTFIFAGHETTAHLLSWFFVAMSDHPEVKRKVFEEVTKTFGDDTSPSTTNLSFYQKIQEMEYLPMVIKEVFRMYNPVPNLVSRHVTTDCQVGDLKIRRGTIVSVSPIYVHAHPKYWDNPKKFIPERFSGKMVQDCRYLPFGVGVRSCIGQFFALLEAKIIIIHMLLAFEITIPEQNIIPKPRVVMNLKEGLIADLEPRKETRGK